jgi:hypothetical protein
MTAVMPKEDMYSVGPWIETFSGTKFHLLDPQPEEINEIDIAHALSNQCRYTGHVKKFFSVAEHSYHVSLLVPATQALAGLLHDASEAYITDLSRPIKQLTPVGPPYYEIEDRIMRVIAAKYGFNWPMSPEVKKADNTMLLLEKDRLMSSLSWSDDASSVEARKETVASVGDLRLACYRPEVMEKIFLQRFYQLT